MQKTYQLFLFVVLILNFSCYDAPASSLPFSERHSCVNRNP